MYMHTSLWMTHIKFRRSEELFPSFDFFKITGPGEVGGGEAEESNVIGKFIQYICLEKYFGGF